MDVHASKLDRGGAVVVEVNVDSVVALGSDGGDGNRVLQVDRARLKGRLTPVSQGSALGEDGDTPDRQKKEKRKEKRKCARVQQDK